MRRSLRCMPSLGVVVIGRNEGGRLAQCLQSVLPLGVPVVYVDSDSSDGSASLAETSGVDVVRLDPGLPLCASRARHEGFLHLRSKHEVAFVFFIDGDCEVVDGWPKHAVEELRAQREVAVVCGRLKEKHPNRSLYNRIADIEWDAPIGEVLSCGGVAVMRSSAYEAVGGFDPTVVAGEEPELCQRLRAAGWSIRRLAVDMALHDSDMTTFGQWWRRAVRSGFGTADLATRFPQDSGGESREMWSVRMWSIAWPLGLLLTAAAARASRRTAQVHVHPAVTRALPFAVACALPLQMLRVSLRLRSRAPDAVTALSYGTLIMVSKAPQLQGQLRYLVARRRSRLLQ